MKSKRILNALLLTALTSMVLVGCNGGNGGSSVTDSSSTAPQQQTGQLRVTLAHNIYLKGQEPVVAKAETYSATLGVWKEINGTVIAEFDKTLTGEVEVTFRAGVNVGTAKIMVYETAEEAAAANSIYTEDAVADLKVDRLYNATTKTPKFTSYEEVIDGLFTGIKVKSAETVAVTDVNTVSNNDNVWTADEANTNKAVLDETRYTVPHTWLDKVQKYEQAKDENGNPKVDDQGLPVMEPVVDADGNPVYEMVPAGYYTAYEEARWKTEMIFDEYGRICYFIYCYPANVWTGKISHPDGINWYSHSAYADLESNPAFLLGSEYYSADGESINKQTDFEKVIPEGGSYLIGANGGAVVTKIFQTMSGEDYIVGDEHASDIFNQELMRANARMEGSRCKFDASSKKYLIYTPASQKQLYVYYHSLTEQGKDSHATADWASVEAYGDAVLKGLVEVTNPLIDTEPVLADYYATYIDDTIAEWRAAILNITNPAK